MNDYQQRKQCPFAFNLPLAHHNMRCLEDQCMAWVKCHNPVLQKDRPNDCADFCKSALHKNENGIRLATFADCAGYCKLIEKGSP